MLTQRLKNFKQNVRNAKVKKQVKIWKEISIDRPGKFKKMYLPFMCSTTSAVVHASVCDDTNLYIETILSFQEISCNLRTPNP